MLYSLPNNEQINVRWMIERDKTEVQAIEVESFEFPWSPDDFDRCLKQRNVVGMVAEHRDRVLGFVIYELQDCRLDLLNLAVCPYSRRYGIGRALVQHVMGKLSLERRSSIEAEIRESNLDAQLFFRRLGFRAVAILPEHFTLNDEDAYLFEYQLAATVPREKALR